MFNITLDRYFYSVGAFGHLQDMFPCMPPETVKAALEQACSDNNKAVEILLGENGKINITFFIIAKQKCTCIILATASARIILKE